MFKAHISRLAVAGVLAVVGALADAAPASAQRRDGLARPAFAQPRPAPTPTPGPIRIVTGADGTVVGYASGPQAWSAGYTTAGPGTSVTGTYRSGEASGAGVIVVDGNNSSLAWSQTSANGGSSGSVNGSGVRYDQRGPDGDSSGGGLRTGPNWRVDAHNFDSSGNGWGGSVGRDGRAVTADGEYRQSGVIPGTQDRFGAGVRIDGRDSSVAPRWEVFDATGSQRLGGASAVIDRRQAVQRVDVGFGPVKATGTDTLRFGGVNSTLDRSSGVRVAGVSETRQDVRIDRSGVGVKQEVNVGGVRASAGVRVDASNGSVRVQKPTVTVPPVRLPERPTVTVPPVKRPELPRVTVPPVRLPDMPKPSAPPVRVGGRKLF